MMKEYEKLLSERASETNSPTFQLGVRAALADFYRLSGIDRVEAERRAARRIPIGRDVSRQLLERCSVARISLQATATAKAAQE